MFEESSGQPPLTITVRGMLICYGLFLMPWLPFLTLMGTGMAFEAGYTFDAYLFVVQVWMYPALVGVAYLFRRRKPALIWLPMLPLIPALVSLVKSSWP